MYWPMLLIYIEITIFTAGFAFRSRRFFVLCEGILFHTKFYFCNKLTHDFYIFITLPQKLPLTFKQLLFSSIQTFHLC